MNQSVFNEICVSFLSLSFFLSLDRDFEGVPLKIHWEGQIDPPQSSMDMDMLIFMLCMIILQLLYKLSLRD